MAVDVVYRRESGNLESRISAPASSERMKEKSCITLDILEYFRGKKDIKT